MKRLLLAAALLVTLMESAQGAFWTASKTNVSIAARAMVKSEQSTNTHLGIGTTTPAANLDVPGTAAIGALQVTNGITGAGPDPSHATFDWVTANTNLLLPNLASNLTPVANLAVDATGRVFKVPVSSGSGSSWPSTLDDFRGGNRLFDDFTYLTVAAESGVFGWRKTVSTGTIQAKAGEDGRPGILRVSTGAGAGNYASLNVGTSANCPFSISGSWTNEVAFRLNSTNNVDGFTNQYEFFVGFGDKDDGSIPPQSGFGLMYTSNAPNYQLVQVDNNTRTTNDSGVLPVPSSWVKFRSESIRTPGVETNIIYYINGVSVLTNAVNMPLSTRNTGLQFVNKKANGAISTTIDLDYWYLAYRMVTNR